MKRDESNQPFSRSAVRGRASVPLLGPVLTIVICLAGIAACAERPDPLQQAFNAVGGQEALQELNAFSYTSTGERFESGQSVNPEAGSLRSSSFDLALENDVEGDRLSLDWQRQIYDPARGEVAYQEIIDGDHGYQTGNYSVFNPAGTDVSRALPSEHIAAVRRESAGDDGARYRVTSRRILHSMNGQQRKASRTLKRYPTNPAFMNPGFVFAKWCIAHRGPPRTKTEIGRSGAGRCLGVVAIVPHHDFCTRSVVREK